MQHRDREQFVAGIARIIEELYGSQPQEQLQAMLLGRIHPLLDAFLLESQAIVPTEATILIADIRGFTSLSETYPPKVVIKALNRYFQVMSSIVKRHGGLVDKFMGDAIMALFGAPLAKPDDLRRALACAVQMQQAMQALNRRSEARGEPSLHVGIAVNTGMVMAGSYGSSTYSEYTVIGDAVNVASRMEGYSLRGQILLSETSRTAAADYVEVGTVNAVAVKGKRDLVTLYELQSITHPQRIEVPKIEPRRSPRVKVDLPMSFRRVEGKRVFLERFQGRVKDIGYHGMSADLPLMLPRYSEILVSVRPALGREINGDVYARILRSNNLNGTYRTQLEFTSIGTPGHEQIKQYVDQLLWHR